MKDLESIEKLASVANIGGVSDDLLFLRDEFLFFNDFDSNPLTKEHQSAIYSVTKLAEAFKKFEMELYPDRYPNVEILKTRLNEAQALLEEKEKTNKMLLSRIAQLESTNIKEDKPLKIAG